MKRNLLFRSSLVLLGTLCLASTTGTDLTPAERARAIRYLNDTSAALAKAVSGLSDAQWKFKPGPERWSVAEVVEHLALIEGAVHQVFGKLADAPAPSAGFDAKQVDAAVLAKVPDRTTKYQAPELAVPTGRWSPSETLAKFLAGREKSIELAKTRNDLRGHIVPHPVLGPMDGYEWLLAAAAHTERHTQQILEVEADANFPKSTH